MTSVIALLIDISLSSFFYLFCPLYLLSSFLAGTSYVSTYPYSPTYHNFHNLKSSYPSNMVFSNARPTFPCLSPVWTRLAPVQELTFRPGGRWSGSYPHMGALYLTGMSSRGIGIHRGLTTVTRFKM
jgi:hypothetical protein